MAGQSYGGVSSFARTTARRIASSRSPLRPWPTVFAALLLVGMTPLALLNFATVQGTRDRLVELGVANLTSRSTSTTAAIDAYIQNRRRDIILVSQLPDVIAYAQNLNSPAQRDSARAALAAAASVSPAYESIAVLSLDGVIQAASIQTDEGTNVRFRDYFQNARTGIAYVSDPSYSVITNRPALFFSAPVKTSTDILVGVVRSRLNLAQIWDLVEGDHASVGPEAHAFLVDDFGIRLAVSETKDNRDRAESLIYRPIAPIDLETATRLAADRRFGQKTAEQLVIDPLPELKDVMDRLRPGEVASFAYRVGGVEQRAAAVKLETKPWVYVVAMPPGTYTNALGGPTLALVLTAGLVLLLAALLAGWVVRSITGAADSQPTRSFDRVR
ncbi:MAG: cache domain-containing protein [Candidatus Limnocylindria bacterium]